MIKNINIRLGNIIKMLKVISLFFLIFSVNSLSQTTYYVSSSQGDDANPGTSDGLPWRTLSKVNSVEFLPGDQILFKKGDFWKGNLVIKNSGTSVSRITIASYGEGTKPIITLREAIPGWSNSSNWIEYSSNIWRIIAFRGIISKAPTRLWLDGIEDAIANGLWDSNYDGTFGVNNKHRFLFEKNDSSIYLYVYSPSNPANFYSSMEYPGRIHFDGTYVSYISYACEINNANYITIDGLEFQGGMYSGINMNNSDHVIIENCNIGKYSTMAGISGTNGSDFITIRKNIIDSDFGVAQFQQYSRSSGIQYGTVQYGGASYWNIHDNYIKWWAMGGFYVGNLLSGQSKYHKFYNNIVTNPSPATYGKGGQIYSEVPGDNSTFCEVYNNIFQNTPMGLQISASNNKFYFNIFYNMTGSTSTYSSDGFAFSLLKAESPDAPKNNYIFNNTIINSKDYAITFDGDITDIFNNLFINCGEGTYNKISTRLGRWSKLIYKNNLFFRSDKNISDRMIYLMEVDGFTISGLNNLNGLYNKTVANNLQHVGQLVDLIDTNDFSLPPNSLALNSGMSISNFIQPDFRDRNGNPVNLTTPHIGALQGGANQDLIPPRLISALLTDSAKLVLSFSEPLNPVNISNISNYLISNAINIHSAELVNSQLQIILTTSPHVYANTYSITVINLMDVSGNVIQPSGNSTTYQNNFNPPTTGVGKLLIYNIIASDTGDVNFGPDKTIDGLYFSNGGSPNSYWKSSLAPQWLMYDLGSIKSIYKTKISFYEFQNGRIYKYNIYISFDGANWVKLINNAYSLTQEWTVNEFENIQTRYLKLEILNNNFNSEAAVWEVEIIGSNSSDILIIDTKIFLQGAYANGQMTTILNDLSSLPHFQPYQNEPWNYHGFENLSVIPAGIVDWVLIELRTDTSASSTVSRRVAFLRFDGRIVEGDALSPVVFYGIDPGYYYLVIRHRNHLSIMSTNKIALSDQATFYDFTQSPSSVFGNDLANLGSGNYGMFAGDGDANGVINVLDYSIVGNNLFLSGYRMGDLNLNSLINIMDYGQTHQNLFKYSFVPF